MSYKRSRSTFETDGNHAPYALFGTPLPDEVDARDDGAYLPLWKQEVRDERGRKRLHGAFTGGWSAGYFNTVGSKEGWAPSAFVSSRGARHKDGAASKQQRAEDYMDEEDLADAAESQQIQTSQAFAGLGTAHQGAARPGGLMGLLKTEGNTMGLQLLRRMGWKDGQGIGAKVRRSARLDMAKPSGSDTAETHLFAPDNAPMIQFVRKTDRMGLGHRGQAKLQGLAGERDAKGEADDDDDEPDEGGRPLLLASRNPKPKPARGAFGVGVLNDNGSDEEDPYDIGPKIKYNRVIGGDKKKKKKATAVANPSLDKAPKFVPKNVRSGDSFRRCHDGRLPLSGFVLAKVTEDFAALFSEYAPPVVPPDWKSAKDPAATSASSDYLSTADAAKASSLGPRERAALLGEKALPGKSVFDFISASARDKLATASGKSDLPPARGEIPAELAMSEEERRKALWDRAPKLDRDTAAAALARSAGGPYADDEGKRTRYRRYLENQSNPGLPPPEKRGGSSDDDFLREMNEFYNCARIFKPMTGFMASRFTTSKTVLNPSSAVEDKTELLSKPEPKAADPAEEAAKMGMFGHMTRTVVDFYPSRLLCKRFNVRAPEHSRPDNEPDAGQARSTADAWPVPAQSQREPAPATTSAPFGALPAPGRAEGPAADAADAAAEAHAKVTEVNAETNEAVEGKAASQDVLRAIFGDSDTVFPSLIDATYEDLSDGLEKKLFTSVDLVKTYLARIEQVNGEVHSVTEINPDALETAAELDKERAAGNIRGQPLHGIPMLLKNSIGTADRMNTTAGSWILFGAKVPRDAGVVTKLRAAGVVILGKTNLCQWAGYRCKKPSSGWSAHGGQTLAAYYEAQEPCGSSGGSAVAVDLGLAFAALGTETDGSIVWPAQRSGVAGTIARTVRDAAYALQAIAGPDPNDGYTALIPAIPDFNADNKWDVEIAGFRQALEVLERNGATVVEVEFSAKLDELREADLAKHPEEGFPEKNTAHWDDGLLGALDRHDLTAAAMPTTLAAEWAAVVGGPVVSVPLGHYPADAGVVRLDDGVCIDTAPGTRVVALRRRHRRRDLSDCCEHDADTDADADADREREQSPPPQYPASEASSSSRPPPFSSLFAPLHDSAAAAAAASSSSAPNYAAACPESEPFDPDQAVARAFRDPVAETKKPPPAYSEGDSPLHSFSFVMSAAGGAASIITQVQQGGPPINAIGDVGADETIAMDLRGTRFVLSRDELLTLPEFVLLSLFPNGLFPEGHMNGFSENDAVQVDYDPASLQYMLDFFRNVAQSIPSESSPSTSQDGDAMDSLGSRDESAKRAGIIVLREDLDFYAIPPSADISQPDMIEVKRAAARALQQQNGIFSGLKRSDEPGTTEAHLIEMLTAGGFNHDDRWGHRAGEPNKAVICSLALARLRSDIRGNDMGTSAVGMAQKLLLFWRKPARRCWWEGIELDNIDGVDGKLKVWIRRVWTLEMSVIGLR
ncbi:GNAT family acetyltransferase [Purpureocillium lavendulum]|uniref:GNAT family acetyltransferase n=1 Tax=Purpureocillium lavendulum TaxID=1247861 RepID=A0AB34FFP2_9HYPO|nr:GNAT family acetyltransferase [Purpureocillium lavendulum]